MRQLLLAALFVVQTSAASAQVAPERLERYVTTALDAWQVPGVAIAIVRNDSVVLTRGYGVRTTGSFDPVTATTVFGIGSTTKAFTSTLLAMLADSGLIRWDDPVSRHLPGFQLPNPWTSAQATIRDLLAHRTGLAGSDFVWYASRHDRAELIRRARFMRRASPFRTDLAYNNVMYIAAGGIAQAVTGESWDELVTQRIFAPLGMTRTATWFAGLPTGDNLATPHARIRDTVRAIDRRTLDNLGPAGAINSSAADLARWVRFLLAGGRVDGKQLVSPGHFADLFTPQLMLTGDGTPPIDSAAIRPTHFEAYAMGWFLKDYYGRLVAEHGGNVDGMSATITMVPEARLGVVVLSNMHNTQLPGILADWIVDRELGVPDLDRSAIALRRAAARREQLRGREARLLGSRKVGTAPSLPLDRYTGVYRDSLYGDLTVTRAGDSLVAQLGPGLRGSLGHWHHDIFRAEWSPAMWGSAFLTFRVNPTGQVDGFEIDLGGEPAPLWFGRADRP
ncbi:MAG: serine hydrolase [Gemmatimonadales bacterium]